MVKNYFLVFIAFLCFSLSGYGQTYTKITNIGDLTDGYYVIAEENDAYAMSNSHTGSVLEETSIAPVASVITNPPATIIWKIETNGSGRTIYSEDSSKYVSYTGSSNNVQIVNAVSTNNQRWNITYSGGDFIFSNLAVTARDLKYNPSAPRFACYTGGQRDIALYKLDAPAGPTITAAPTTLTGLDYFYNMPPSSEDTFTVEGSLLTNNIVVTAPTDFEISLTTGTGFTNSITLNESSGTVASTTIYVRLISGKAIGTYTDNVEITSTGATTKTVSVSGDVVDIYCNAGPTSSSDSEIENVTLTGVSLNINNDTSGTCTGGTGGVINDFTAQSADVYPGGSYTLSVEFGDCNNGTQYDGSGGVWIDWNNDGDFDDTDEEITTLNVAVSGGNITENITINVPAAQALGDYRMRIVQDEGGTAGTISPCGTFSWGSVEDYTVTVVAATGNLITVTQATGGAISPGSTIVADNANQSFTATPDTCYTFTNWVVDGTNAGSTNPYTFTNVTANHTITAVYTQDTYNITATAGANGTISPTGVTSVGCGNDQTYTITADSGYIVDDVLVDGVSVGAVTSYDFPNVTTTHTISVSFAVYVAPQIVITEFAGKGYDANFNDEYIEIANFGTTSVDLTGWFLKYYESSLEETVNLSGILAPNTAYVIAARSLHTAAISPDIVASFSMNNQAYAVLLEGTTVRDEAGSSSNKFNDDYNYEFTDCSNDNKPTSNWDNLGTGNGTPGVVNCNAPKPELQLVDNTATNQDCGFTLDYGDVAIGSTSDLTFDIENIGTLDLSISGLAITGDYTIISPATVPFIITPGNAQTVTIRLTPLSDDPIFGELTITSNDDDEASCIVNLAGTGFTPGPNINVRGVVGSNPTIANGSTTTAGFNNTLFAAQTINTTQQTKNFRIGNEAGSAPLTVSDITLSGDTADFVVTSSFSNPFAVDTHQDFTITFQPTTDSGLRSATVTITNSDSNKNPYTFVVEGNANCPLVSGTIAPAEGPIGTIVTVLSPGNNLTGATATLNGVALTTVSSDNAELLVRLPNTITTGGALSVELTTGCIFSNPFTLINETIAGCETTSSGSSLSDLFISEVTDSSKGSLTYIELYNATGATINFATTNYTIKIYNNGSGSTSHSFVINSGSIANNGTFIIATGLSTVASQCTETTGGDGSLGDMTIANSGASVNFHKDNNTSTGHDFIGLYSGSSTLVDAWGVFGDATWATGLGLGESGANFQRDTAATLPNTTFSISDWIITDWTGSECDDVDYSTIGSYDFSTGEAPTITIQPIDSDFNCEFATSFTITGTEGSNEPGDTQELTYQWFYTAPGDTAWTGILSGNADYTGQQSATLNIANSFNLNGYQYYCQLREDDATCYKASNAATLEVLVSEWNGTTWSTPPTIDSAVILNGGYDTTTNGSFSACSLIVNATYVLNIQNGDYIQIANDIIADGDITVFSQGAVVQMDDSATVTANGTITVQKETTILNTPYDYTYWSSPVASETIENVFSTVSASRRFSFNAANFIDLLIENNNTGTFTVGQDDIDDDGDDWQLASGTMTPGMGYAATPSTFGPALPIAQIFQFVGPFNNGVITPTIVNNSLGAYKDWNLIGNPYPSAIDTDVFFAANSATVNAIHLWNQATAANANASGSQGMNFSSADYAVISASGVNTAGGDLALIPNNFVPSGQGFFIEALSNTPIVFNNSMRVTGDNNQFFRNANTINQRHVLWLNLTSDNGVAKQMAVAHLEGATDTNDGSFYDVKENLSAGTWATLYSTIADSEGTQFVIQGKETSSLDINEVITLGFKTNITAPTLYNISIAQFEGDFYTSNIIYIKDNLLNTTHNLKDSDYTFTSETGEFNDRFEIVFTQSTLSIDNNIIDANTVTITEFQNGDVQIKVGKTHTIKHVAIIDVTGRIIYNLPGNDSTEVYNLSKLSQAAYIAKITLSNGQVISKKAIKKH
ncbi:lamin tail-like protein [Winogradskyella pacifica]|uniref:Lamin tail-like protein n=1 Tax=Winogradskyella pacifica TaxID=664642 RepID=A0A3D9MD87_9FLAO|nr:GEVED domain-containing protein [Winogradskyella pacifica]REE17036.1 lamin tail-like protein [Winogradskyella pacifica]